MKHRLCTLYVKMCAYVEEKKGEYRKHFDTIHSYSKQQTYTDRYRIYDSNTNKESRSSDLSIIQIRAADHFCHISRSHLHV